MTISNGSISVPHEPQNFAVDFSESPQFVQNDGGFVIVLFGWHNNKFDLSNLL